MRGKILALDVATNTGIAFGDPKHGLPELSSIRFGDKGDSLEAAFAAAMIWFENMLRELDPDCIVFEAPLAPSFSRGHTNITTTRKLMGLVAVIGAVAHRLRFFDLAEANVADIRQHFLGVRNMRGEAAKKATMARCREYGGNPRNDNEGDAFALWAAERALRGFALGRKSWLFAGSERGASRAAAMVTLIMTAQLNDIDPLAWLADVLARIASLPQSRLHELLPWEWKRLNMRAAA